MLSMVGQEKELFRGLNNESGYGDDSPFRTAAQDGSGKIASLDLMDQDNA